MIDKHAEELEAFLDAYRRLLYESKSDVEYDYGNRHHHPRMAPSPPPNPPPPTPSRDLHEQQQGNWMPTNTIMATPPLKLLPTPAAIRSFSSDEADYFTRDFILKREDVMKNSFVSDQGDKISFVRFGLKPG